MSAGDTPLGQFFQRVARSLAREPLQLHDVGHSWHPSAPGAVYAPVVIDANAASPQTSATLNDDLVVTVFSWLNAVIRLTGLVRRSDGTTTTIGPSGVGYLFAAVGTRVPQSITLQGVAAADVITLTASVVGVTGSNTFDPDMTQAPIGAIWMIVQRSRTMPDGTQVITGNLLSGSVSSVQPIGYPDTRIRTSIEGEPLTRAIGFSMPLAAGAQWRDDVPFGVLRQMVSCAAQLTCSAVVGNRLPILRFSIPILAAPRFVVADYPSPATIPQNFAEYFTWASGATPGSTGGQGYSAQGTLATPCMMPALTRIESLVAGFDAGDTWSNGSAIVRDWLTGSNA